MNTGDTVAVRAGHEVALAQPVGLGDVLKPALQTAVAGNLAQVARVKLPHLMQH